MQPTRMNPQHLTKQSDFTANQWIVETLKNKNYFSLIHKNKPRKGKQMNTFTLKPMTNNDKGELKNILADTPPSINDYPWSRTYLKNNESTNQSISIHAAHVVAHSFLKSLVQDKESVNELPSHDRIIRDIEAAKAKIFKKQQFNY